MTRAARPLLSVLMPTYNGARHLPLALGSIVENLTRTSGADLEIVVADDGSADDTLAILEDYATRLPLRIVQRERVGSWVESTNAALRSATGDYACFLHQDDLWMPGRLAAIRRELAGPEPTLVVHDAQFVDDSGRSLGRWRCPFPRRAATIPPREFVERLLVQNFLAIPAPVFKRAAALEAGELDPTLWYTADWDFWLRMARLGPVRYLPEPLAAFRVHATSQTMAPNRTHREFEQQTSAVLARHLGAWAAGVAPDHARRVGAVATFSSSLNATLAGLQRGERVRWATLASSFLALRPGGWARYARDSRIVERVSSRLRAGLR